MHVAISVWFNTRSIVIVTCWITMFTRWLSNVREALETFNYFNNFTELTNCSEEDTILKVYQ